MSPPVAVLCIDNARGRCVLPYYVLEDSLFDAGITWMGRRQARLFLRHYAMEGSLSVELDAELTAKVTGLPEPPPVALTE